MVKAKNSDFKIRQLKQTARNNALNRVLIDQGDILCRPIYGTEGNVE